MMAVDELSHTNLLKLLSRDFEIRGGAPGYEPEDTGYYVYHGIIGVQTAINLAAFKMTLWLKFDPQNTDTITHVRFRKGFDLARFNHPKNRDGMKGYKTAYNKIKNLSYGADGAQYVMLELKLDRRSILKDLHKFYIECHNATQYMTEMIRTEIGDEALARGNGVSVDRISKPKPMRDNRNIGLRRFWLVLFGLLAVILYGLNLTALAGVFISLLSAANEVDLINRLEDLLGTPDWLTRLLEVFQNRLGDILSTVIQEYRERVRPLVESVESLLGYSLPALMIDLLAALTAQFSGTFITAFRRHLRQRSVILTNSEGPGSISSRWLGLDRREMETYSLRHVFGKTLQFFLVHLTVYALLVMLILTTERYWTEITAFVLTQWERIGL